MNDNNKTIQSYGLRRKELKKKNYPSKKRKLIYIFLFIFGILGIILVYTYINFFYTPSSDIQQVYNNCHDDSCKIKLDTVKQCQFPPFCNPELPKTNNRTNILIVGIDTKERATTYLTDTIMLISYDHTTGVAYMISIPRDTDVSFTNSYGNNIHSKINTVYYYGGYNQKDHEKGMLAISNIMTQITGFPIHYNIMVSLNGFEEAIDKIGGLNINISQDHGDVYPYDELSDEYKAQCKNRKYIQDADYCYFYFNKGQQVLNGQMALIYARSRKYSTDYSRARRQQEVVNAFKDQIFSSSTLSNPQKLFDLAQTLSSSIKTSNYNLGDVIAALNLRDKYKISINIVLDPNFGGLNNYVYAGASYTNYFKDTSYKSLQQYLDRIYTNPFIYKESAKISTYNATGISKLNIDYNRLIKDTNILGLTIISQNKIVKKDTLGLSIGIIDYTNGQKPETLKWLQNNFPELSIIDSNKVKAISGEDFVIYYGTTIVKTSSESSSSSLASD